MKWWIVILCVVALVGTSVACGSEPGETTGSGTTTEDVPDYSGASDADTETGEETVTEDEQGSAKLGDWWELETNDTKLKVWATKYQKKVPHDEWSEPENKRFDAVYLKIKNVGGSAYDDSITNCVTAINTQGNTFNATYMTEKKPSLDSVTIPPGQTRAGWVILDVGGTVETVMFAADSGFSQFGQWSVK